MVLGPTYALYSLVGLFIYLYTLVIIAQVGLSWLIAFEIINANNEAARKLMALLKKLTDPVFNRVRKFVPPIGGLDLTPLVVIIGMNVLSMILFSIIGIIL